MMHIFTDSVEAVRECRKSTTTNQQTEDIRILVKQFSEKVCILEIKKIPGHQGIRRNERANKIARAQL